MSERYRPNRSSRGDEVRVKREHRSRSRSLSRERRRRSKHDSSHERKRSHKKDVKKERSRTRSLSSTSSDEESRLDKLLDKKRLERFQKEREEKRRRKELETPDEKRSRRLAKKLQKEERRRAEALSAFPEGIPYTDLNNPFNDTSLTETFVWKKKWETEGKADISRKKVEKINRNIIAKNFAEMETLKRNREARDAAREDMEMIARDQDRRLCDWNRTEDVFHLKQAGLRSEIRIKEGRGKPIDFIGRYIAYTEEENKAEEFELDQNVLSYFPTDSIDDFEDLIADIKIYRVIDGGKNKSYWDDIEIVAKSGLKKLMENRHRSTDSGTVHSSVQEEVLKIFKGKSYDELEQLESQIGAKIKNARKGTDVSYWESLLDQLRPYMAKQRLRELHTKMQQLRLKRLREEQMQDLGIEEEDEEDEEEEKEGEAKKHADVERPTKTTSIDKKEEEAEMMEMDEEEKVPILAEEVEKVEELTMKQIEEVIEEEQKPAKTTTVSLQKEGVAGGGISAEQRQPTLPFSIESMLKLEDDQREQCYQILETRHLIDQFGLASYEHGRYSPVYGTETQIMPGIEILDECEDAESLAITRSKHRQEGGGGGAQSSAEDQRLMEIAKKGMTKDEAVFAVEEALEKQHFLWSDKYRPRKPRYFNRVHTGFDWNKYNQTHYDIDNPPPKIVQGYRFNIFYPDLLDPTQTPKFQLIKCEGDVDFAILRFQAGPPYEDIAFKIVNREWEVSYKHGYKCQFQNGVFQLWFFFKRYRYRR